MLIQMTLVFSILFQVHCALAQGTVSLQAVNKNRVEDLLIWKISEDLKLSVKEEKEITELIKSLSNKKSELNQKIEDLTQKMAKANKNEKSKLLIEYKKNLKSMGEISIEEFDRVQKILGIDKAAQYFVVKTEVANRIRNFLGGQEKSETIKSEKTEPKSFPDPKLIEE